MKFTEKMFRLIALKLQMNNMQISCMNKPKGRRLFQMKMDIQLLFFHR